MPDRTEREKMLAGVRHGDQRRPATVPWLLRAGVGGL